MRARIARTGAFCVLLLSLAAAGAAALDLGVETWAGNLGFDPERTATSTKFPGASYFWGLSLYGSQAITDKISFETGFYADPILRSTSYTLFSYSEKILSIGVGPFFGLFNDPGTLLKSGISTAVRLELPGIAFVSFRSDSSIGGQLVETGDYLQARNDIAFGFYVPNAICTLSLNTRKFEQKAETATVIDSLTEYVFSTDIYRKNVPYRLVVSFSYQSLDKSFVAATTSRSTLNSLLIGTELAITIADSVLLRTGVEGAVYSFGTGALVGSAPDFLFRAWAGVQVNADRIPFISRLL